MLTVIQRVSGAELSIAGKSEGRIGRGIVALVGIEKSDGETSVRRMAERLLSYRIFPDSEGRMNLSLSDIEGGLLVVPNFTVAADTAKGTRASFTAAASPAEAEQLFNRLADHLRAKHPELCAGSFGADMQISLTNDGPVTFILHS